jgi:cyclic pyranopterin phosphate synthase
VVAALREQFRVEVHTSTVLTRLNVPHLGAVYSFLRALGVDQVVFNAMMVNGGAHTHFEELSIRYTEIVRSFRLFLAGQPDVHRGGRVMAFLVDVPFCVTEGIPDFNRGFVEKHVHHAVPAEAERLLEQERYLERREEGRRLLRVGRDDIDRACRQLRAECDACRCRTSCPGVWTNYLARNGWAEFVPVRT